VGDARIGARAARAGKRGTIRRRAVGTRDRIISHLTAAGDITDQTGMASTKLAEAVGYPGSSVAFAQLLSGMERDGLIEREVRGKRTYRITLPEGVAAARAAKAADRAPAGTGPAGAGLADPETARAVTAPGAPAFPPAVAVGASGAAGGFDYDELARRLLVQVLRKLASASVTGADLATVDAVGALAERTADDRADDQALGESEAERADREKTAVLQETVAGLERELATAWTRHGSLTAENAKLREQLSQAQRDLALERTRRAPLSGELNQAEVVVLERLLDTQGEGARKAEQPGATAS
jgi:hypothetical protein